MVLRLLLMASLLPAAASAQTPAVCDPYEGPRLRGYLGAMHEHSSYSDGDIFAVPRDYFEVGKARGLHYMGSAEHSDTYDRGNFVSVGSDCFSTPDGLLTCLGVNDDRLAKWEATARQVGEVSDERFVAVRGFEWTSDRFGHINVYFSQNFSNAKTDLGYVALLEPFWEWLVRDPATPGLGGSATSPVPFGGGGDGLAHFNHPGDKCLDAADPGCNWFDFEYVPEADAQMFGIELFNPGGDDRYEPFYIRALDRGWHVGAVAAEDEHGIRWADPARAKTVTLMPSLSRENLKAAWAARRTYALSTAQSPRILRFEAEGHPMGSRLRCEAGGRVRVLARLSPRGEPFSGTLELVSRGGEVVAGSSGPRLVARLTVTDEERWYYLRARGADGRLLTVSSPVWIAPR